MSDSLRPYGLYPTRLLRPWDSPGKNNGAGSHFFLQGIFLTQGSNPSFLCLLHCSTFCNIEQLRKPKIRTIIFILQMMDLKSKKWSDLPKVTLCKWQCKHLDSSLSVSCPIIFWRIEVTGFDTLFEKNQKDCPIEKRTGLFFVNPKDRIDTHVWI